jgi:methionyl aminopeptidase
MSKNIKTKSEITTMKKAAKILSAALSFAQTIAKPGMTTKELDLAVEKFILDRGGKPGFKGYLGFPATICKAVNDEIVHGIPDDTPLQEGDIITVDCGVLLDGYNSDSAVSFAIGEIPKETQHFMDVCQQALYEGIKMIKPGVKTGDLGHKIQTFIESNGYYVFKDLIGHGIGKKLWEEPQVPNFGTPNTGVELKPGMVICVEPIIGQSTNKMITLEDNWTIVTQDMSLGCQFEHMILITKTGCEVLTKRADESIPI